MEPMVSVIMPAYRCVGTIGKAIDSVLKQDVSLELIIIDDCSQDGLEEYLKKEYPEEPSIRYIQNEQNMGAAESRNRGILLARGTYIAFLDADDWWSEGKLSRQIARIEETDTVLCCTGRELVTPDGRLTGRVIPVQNEITYKMLLRGNVINCSSVLMRAEILKQYRMEHEDSHEDYILWLHILKDHKKACGIADPLLKYRLSNKGKSGSKLKSAGMTYKVYRYAGFGLLSSCWYFACYAFNGMKKYLKA